MDRGHCEWLGAWVGVSIKTLQKSESPNSHFMEMAESIIHQLIFHVISIGVFE